ncbi:BgTH12-04794 [Blumeria graminis f. sp. triticale]|uniref:Chorismate mutase n=3 Tax=Blumeria graminis TaxID=34373 RepID=A0A061HIX5_BLUGR|nr:Chorismate mutase [Blumeria graminis f. sp. tritici 96224]CAD6499142.1 BgTH12-04794 [Blumeria graminis f. sp. triticale]VCU39260.1 Bgt-4268 [Blumeria graminis f. sp. tritici]
MDTAIDLSDPSMALNLNHIRRQLIRMEETITFHLIERAQYPLNPTIYRPGGVKIPNCHLSLLDWILREREKIDSLIRRYQSPDEHCFFPDALQEPILQPLNIPQLLHHNNVNCNEKIKKHYIELLLPTFCLDPGRTDKGERAENYGSAATADVLCLQAISRRIHFGKWVAESKYLESPEKFNAMIKAKDRRGIEDAITKPAVERQVLDRIRLKSKVYGTDPSIGQDAVPKIDVDAVVGLYENCIVPLTKEVEVEYLMQRLDVAE